MRLFEKDGDYEAFERVLAETLSLRPMRLPAYGVMPNHWHMVVWPREDAHLAVFMQRVSIIPARRWQGHRHLVGTGHIYHGPIPLDTRSGLRRPMNPALRDSPRVKGSSHSRCRPTSIGCVAV